MSDLGAHRTATRTLLTPLTLSDIYFLLDDFAGTHSLLNQYNTSHILDNVLQSQPKQYLRIRGTIEYTDSEEEYTGSVYWNTTSMIVFHMVCEDVLQRDRLSRAFYGNPFFVDQPTFSLRYLFTNGIETWNVSIYQNRITLSHFEDDEILYATERWADSIGCFT